MQRTTLLAFLAACLSTPWLLVAACGGSDAGTSDPETDAGEDRSAPDPKPDSGAGTPDASDAGADAREASAPDICGDGVVTGDETCDDGDAGAGCSPRCHVEPGYACDTPGQPCRKVTCNDGVREGSEACDDGNDNLGDGCTPGCRVEPECPSGGGACTSRCGDGVKVAAEGCDDGNRYDGDGCSSGCTVEPGWTCSTDAPPASLLFPLVVRDFRMGWTVGPTQTRRPQGHIDFENNALNRGVEKGIVTTKLGADGKPVYARATGGSTTTTGKAAFDQWFRKVVDVNLAFHQTMTLPVGGSDYAFTSVTFFPVDGVGFGNELMNHNFAFTTETRFWFEYGGGESIAISGDDDFWVFVDKRLVVDLGGIHGQATEAALLDSLGLTAGSIYEVAVFQAERHTTQSRYNITLKGFRNRLSACKQ